MQRRHEVDLLKSGWRKRVSLLYDLYRWLWDCLDLLKPLHIVKCNLMGNYNYNMYNAHSVTQKRIRDASVQIATVSPCMIRLLQQLVIV